MTLENLKQKILSQMLIIFTRYLIGAAFAFSSIVKISGNRFTNDSGADNPINSAWHFFETLYQSGIYWKFLGLAQLMAGFLLMTQRFARLGAVVFLPIILNIFIITISYDFRGTPVITGLMLFATLLLLFWEKDQLKIFWNQQPVLPKVNALEFHIGWQWIGLVLFLFVSSNKAGVKLLGILPWIGITALIVIVGAFLTIRDHKKHFHSDKY
ncbi:MAG: hypothetical protein ACI9A7_001795 [Cyclobacteriaceae bacterium]|jgi:hypothetical protein